MSATPLTFTYYGGAVTTEDPATHRIRHYPARLVGLLILGALLLAGCAHSPKPAEPTSAPEPSVAETIDADIRPFLLAESTVAIAHLRPDDWALVATLVGGTIPADQDALSLPDDAAALDRDRPIFVTLNLPVDRSGLNCRLAGLPCGLFRPPATPGARLLIPSDRPAALREIIAGALEGLGLRATPEGDWLRVEYALG